MHKIRTKILTITVGTALVVGLTGAKPEPAGASTAWYSRTQEVTVPLTIYMQSLSMPPALITRVVATFGTLMEAMGDNTLATSNDIANFMHTWNSLAVYWGMSPTQLATVDQALVNPLQYEAINVGYNLNTPLGNAIAQSGLPPITAASMLWPGIDSHPLVTPNDITGFAHDVRGLYDTSSWLHTMLWAPMTNKGYEATDPNLQLAWAYTQNIWDSMNPNSPDPFAPVSTTSPGCCYSSGGPHYK